MGPALSLVGCADQRGLKGDWMDVVGVSKSYKSLCGTVPPCGVVGWSLSGRYGGVA